MFTECVQCGVVYRVTAEHLRPAMGMVRCGNCKTVFNALSTLREAREVDGTAATTVGQQLPFVHAGDRAVVDRSYLEQTGIFSSLEELKRLEAQRRQALDQTQAFQVAGATKVALPDTESRINVKGALRERDVEEESQLAGTAATGLLLTYFSSLALALRNLVRQRRRAGLALSAVAFGVIALLLAGGFMEWIFWAMRESTIQSRLGHIQLVRQGYLEQGVADPFAYLLDPEAGVGDVLARQPEVLTATPRLSFTGLVSHGENTISFTGEGVNPRKEAKIGKYLHIVEGVGLAEVAEPGIVMGQGLAQNLGVDVGDSVVLLSNTASGGINAIEIGIVGIFYTSAKAYDDSALRIPIALARELLRVEGAHSWVMLLGHTEQTEAVVARLREAFRGHDPPLTVVPWTELADFYNKTVSLFSRQMEVVRVIIGLIIVLSISNLLVMSVLDRTAEIGTLMALGLRRRRILQLFLQEGLLLGVIGGAAGVGLGVGLGALISVVGIPMPPPPGMEAGFTGRIMVTNRLAVGGFALAVITTALASIYPAWKASRLQIVDALRYSR